MAGQLKIREVSPLVMRLAVISVMLLNALSVFGQSLRSIKMLEASDVPNGSRILIISDRSITDYRASIKGSQFSLELPQTSLPNISTALRGRAFTNFEVKTSTGSLILSCRLQPQVTYKILQSNGMVQVFFVTGGSSSTAPPSYPSTPTVSVAPPANNGSPSLSFSRARRISRPEYLPTAAPSNTGNAVVNATPPEIKGSRNLRIARVNVAPRLEDYLVRVGTGPGTMVTDFRQVTPKDGEPVTKPTRAFLSYDDSQLYVAFICEDDPDKIRAHLSKREDITGDDYVSVSLDTFHDKRRAYTFMVNPLGVQLDGILTEGQEDDYTFDTIWRSEGRLTDKGYVVFVAIPFKSLRFAGTPVQTWGIALGRSIVRSNETAYWPQITYDVQGFTPQMATLKGLEQISPGRNIELRPYAAFTSSRTLEPVGQGPYATRNEARVGVDAKVVLKDALTLDLTVNPDFSQIESDEPQVLVNQRFEVFFPEKRPFFIENAGFFQTPEQLFFSRRIVDPQFGARLSGKVGKWAIGALAIDDRAAPELFGSDPSDDGRALIGVVRLQREFGDESHFGVLLTNHKYRESSNRVVSADVRLRLNSNWTFTGQASNSSDRDVDGTSTNGFAYLANLSRSGRSFNYDLVYTDRSPVFKTRLGFIPRVDVRQVEQYLSYRWRPGSRTVVSFGPSGYFLVNWDRKGRMQDWYADASFAVELTRQTSFNVSRSESYELFEGHGFRTHNTGIYFNSDPLDWLGLSSSYSIGSTINYFPAVGLLPFEADSTNGSFGLTLRPGSRLNIAQSYIYRRLGVRRAFNPAFAGGESIFNNHISRSKVNYQFNRQFSLRFILDYNGLLPNSELVDLEQEKQLTYDLLATYMVNPGTALYVGYSNRYENLLITPTEHSRFGPPNQLSSRQFFVKLSYLLRY